MSLRQFQWSKASAVWRYRRWIQYVFKRYLNDLIWLWTASLKDNGCPLANGHVGKRLLEPHGVIERGAVDDQLERSSLVLEVSVSKQFARQIVRNLSFLPAANGYPALFRAREGEGNE